MKYEQLKELFDLPLFDLIKKAREVHDANWADNEIQLCTLLSIKTGGCSEDCSYCAQSSRHNSELQVERLMEKDEILKRAQIAKDSGSTRFCMGAAWRGVRSGTKRFDQVVDTIKDVSKLGMEVCVTLGELGPEEATILKEAGVTAGILGLGETDEDRLKLIEVISEFNPQPESVPINSLMPMPGTPLEGSDPVTVFDVVRMIAIARIAVPKAKVRLSAGRKLISEEGQALCFYAGANSIFYGDKLLTASNPSVQKDLTLIAQLGLSAKQPNPNMEAPATECDKPQSPCCAAN